MEEPKSRTDETRQSEIEVNEIEEPKKKVRQRKKLIINKLRAQMEFYFSAANLSKDKFMAGLLKNSPYIELEIFFKFNRIRALTDEMNLLQKAIEKSQILELSADGLRVKRMKEAKKKENDVYCTIYVESIPSHVDHEWVYEMFAQYGTIDYISFPRFKSTGRPKGFAFVEFQTPEMANVALEAFGAIGCKISPDTEPSQLRSICTHENVNMQIENPFSSEEDVKNQTQVPILSEENNKNEDQLKVKDSLGDGDKESTCQEKRKRKDEAVEKCKKVKVTGDEFESGKTIAENTKMKKNKLKEVDSEAIKRPRADDSVVDECGEMVEKVKEGKETKKTNVKIASELENVIKKVRREVEEAKELERNSDTDNKSLQAPKKRPLDEDGKEEGKKLKKQKIMGETTNTSPVTDVGEEKAVAMDEAPSLKVKSKKKKKRKRSRKEKGVALEGTSLKVMSKQEWTRLRNQYLNMQKRNMESLKWDLQKRKYVPSDDPSDDYTLQKRKYVPSDDYTLQKRKYVPSDDLSDDYTKCHDVTSSKTKPEFTPNAVIKISFEEPPQDPKKLQEAIREGGGGGVAYVETTAGEKDVYVRFFSADSASVYLKGGLWSRMILLSGEEETEYWNHCVNSWLQRRNKKNKRMKGTSLEYPNKFRGREKLLQKALKEARNNKPNSHMVFEG